AALLMYCRIRQYFSLPGDVSTMSFTVGGVNFARPLGLQQLNGLNGSKVDYVSAAILYTVVSKRTLGGITFEADTGLSGATMTLGPPDLTQTTKMFKDAWDIPVGYAFISEVHLPELGTDPRFTEPKSATRDPFDPQGKLAN